ncbi:MAG: glycosyltransferase family A protein [Nanoarchaeota archaeon]|nr:glycosyltransferase family A protein [Nanoarchaeota archaeon]
MDTNITVVIPSYNQEPYLADCINSVLTQTVKPHEIIVVDDGSTDNSLEIAKQFPVKVVSQVNKGLASARNTGIMNSTGTWILPLDSDDMLMENCIERLTKEIENQKYNKIFDGKCSDVIGLSFKEFGLGIAEVILMPSPGIEDFKVANRIGYCSLIKKEALLEVGGYSPKMIHGYEDFHLTFNLLNLGKRITTIKDIMWMYRVKEHSMIHDAQKHHVELMTQIAVDFPRIFPEVAKIASPLPKA